MSLAGILSTSRATHENLPTRVANVFGGKTLTVSMSGSEVVSDALCCMSVPMLSGATGHGV